MAVTGYLLHPDQGAGDYQHTPQRACFFMDGTWWLVAQDNSSNDWFLWQWDGEYPENFGEAGNWAKASTSTGTVNIDERDGARIDVFWEESAPILHVVSVSGTAERYSQWSYSAGTGLWTGDILNEDISISLTNGNPERFSVAVDTNGIVWVVYYDNSDSMKLKTRYRANADNYDDETEVIGWNTGPELESTGSAATGGSAVDVVAWSNEGTFSIGCAYSYTTSTQANGVWKFQYRADSLERPSGAWTTETIDTLEIDNHITMAAGSVGGSGDTILVVGKSGSNGAMWKRPPGGPWDDPINLVSGAFTRPKCTIDETNAKAYVLYGDSAGVSTITKIVYQHLDISDLGAETEVVALSAETPGSGDFDEPTAPSHPVNSTMGFLFAASGPAVEGQAGAGAWWNILNIEESTGKLLLLMSELSISGGTL